MASVAEKIVETVKGMSEQQAAAVLDFAQALQAKKDDEYEQAKQKALALLDDPPLALNGRYWSRESLYDRL
ncbi:MAG: hypothetical protein DM484_10785 [Candidatus Methylumidiphilus alinenensis]|uniref:DUF2281 domain-containing protein n=1 Tax=Candidatus Methylumidiphilus alinenensis TaxID=2202197 RepID=A0A2W4TAK0_9GAMM|nr:MAG: hypothetical protein DM484_10785 [Candidatus Methylumidiphilus alinenensis]